MQQFVHIAGLMIPRGNRRECLKAVLALGPGRYWEVAKDPILDDALKAWGFLTHELGDQNLAFMMFASHAYLDPETEEAPFFEAIAPFVVPSPGYRDTNTDVIVTVGDENKSWRYIFEDGKVRQQQAVITWEDV